MLHPVLLPDLMTGVTSRLRSKPTLPLKVCDGLVSTVDVHGPGLLRLVISCDLLILNLESLWQFQIESVNLVGRKITCEQPRSIRSDCARPKCWGIIISVEAFQALQALRAPNSSTEAVGHHFSLRSKPRAFECNGDNGMVRRLAGPTA